MAVAFVFPGQGSQYIGMGKEIYEAFSDAKDVFQEIDDTLSQNLSALMFNGDEAELGMTENTQPALMAVSMAIINVLKKQGGISLGDSCSFMAGHSLGEYCALTAAGTIALKDTARLLKLRGKSMQEAVPLGTGAMAAILGMDYDLVEQVANEAAQGQVCAPANDNSEGQVVISGHREAIERAIAIANEKGAKKAIMLPVSAAFHCSLMAPAAKIMKLALEETTFTSPVVPVVANVTANMQNNPAKLKDLLVQQITGMVRWRESVLYMHAQGVTEMVEIGAGKVLSGLIRRIDRSIACQSVEKPEQIEALIEKLKS